MSSAFTTRSTVRPLRVGRAAIRGFALLASLAFATALTGCRRGVPGPAPRTITLMVENRGYYDVNVYVMPSPSARARLGTVTGGESRLFKVRETDLQAGGFMVLQVRAIAGRTTWTSPSLPVNIGSVARLDVISTAGGNLSQSVFYVQSE